MLFVFNTPLCDYRNDILTDITNIKHVRSRNEDTARDKVKAKTDENICFHKDMLCNICYAL